MRNVNVMSVRLINKYLLIIISGENKNKNKITFSQGKDEDAERRDQHGSPPSHQAGQPADPLPQCQVSHREEEDKNYL